LPPFGISKLFLCMIRIQVLMYDDNSCVDVWSEFMCLCMIRIHVFMHDQNSCVNVWWEFMCWCMIIIHVLMYDQRVWRYQREAIRNRISKKKKQHNSQKKKYKRTNHDRQNIHIKLKIELHESH
jgi:hypothetical protein